MGLFGFGKKKDNISASGQSLSTSGDVISYYEDKDGNHIESGTGRLLSTREQRLNQDVPQWRKFEIGRLEDVDGQIVPGPNALDVDIEKYGKNIEKTNLHKTRDVAAMVEKKGYPRTGFERDYTALTGKQAFYREEWTDAQRDAIAEMRIYLYNLEMSQGKTLEVEQGIAEIQTWESGNVPTPIFQGRTFEFLGTVDEENTRMKQGLPDRLEVGELEWRDDDLVLPVKINHYPDNTNELVGRSWISSDSHVSLSAMEARGGSQRYTETVRDAKQLTFILSRSYGWENFDNVKLTFYFRQGNVMFSKTGQVDFHRKAPKRGPILEFKNGVMEGEVKQEAPVQTVGLAGTPTKIMPDDPIFTPLEKAMNWAAETHHGQAHRYRWYGVARALGGSHENCNYVVAMKYESLCQMWEQFGRNARWSMAKKAYEDAGLDKQNVVYRASINLDLDHHGKAPPPQEREYIDGPIPEEDPTKEEILAESEFNAQLLEAGPESWVVATPEELPDWYWKLDVFPMNTDSQWGKIQIAPGHFVFYDGSGPRGRWSLDVEAEKAKKNILSTTLSEKVAKGELIQERKPGQVSIMDHGLGESEEDGVVDQSSMDFYHNAPPMQGSMSIEDWKKGNNGEPTIVQIETIGHPDDDPKVWGRAIMDHSVNQPIYWVDGKGMPTETWGWKDGELYFICNLTDDPIGPIDGVAEWTAEDITDYITMSPLYRKSNGMLAVTVSIEKYPRGFDRVMVTSPKHDDPLPLRCFCVDGSKTTDHPGAEAIEIRLFLSNEMKIDGKICTFLTAYFTNEAGEKSVKLDFTREVPTDEAVDGTTKPFDTVKEVVETKEKVQTLEERIAIIEKKVQ